MGLADIIVPPARSAGAGPGTVGAIPLTATGGGLIGPIANPSPGAGDWRVALLGALGAPVTDANLKALSYWHQSEGTAAATNNPLAISDGANRYPHAGCLAQCGGNSPIYAFPDQATGVAATAHFLQGSYYTRVVEAFKSNAGLGGIFAAINSSPWCAGCQSGHYPVALYNAIGNPNAPDPGPGGGSGTGTGSTPGATPVGLSNDSDCFIGPFVMPGSVPNIPCLFYKSWGWAIIGALSVVAGVGLMAVGGILLVTKANTVGQAVRYLPTPSAPNLRRAAAPEGEAEGQGTPAPPSTRVYTADEDIATQRRRQDLGGRTSRTASERQAERSARIRNASRARTGEEPF